MRSRSSLQYSLSRRSSNVLSLEVEHNSLTDSLNIEHSSFSSSLGGSSNVVVTTGRKFSLKSRKTLRISIFEHE
jgi:hypothetical protein